MNTRFIEHNHQSALFDFWRRYAPAHGLPLTLMYSVPNAAKRSARMAAFMKAEGLTPGVPDVNLDVARGGFWGLRIEMKRAGQKPHPEQAKALEALRQQGYNAVVCWNVDEAVRVLTAYLAQPPTGMTAAPRAA